MDKNENRFEAGVGSDLNDQIRQTWRHLSDEDIALVDGRRGQFFDRLREIYGISREEAQQHLDALVRLSALEKLGELEEVTDSNIAADEAA